MLYNRQIIIFLLIICYHSEVLADGLSPVSEIYIDHAKGSSCKVSDFATVKGIAGYIWTHDASLSTYKPNQKCFLTIEAPLDFTIVMQAVKFNLGYPPHPESCHGDSLFIFDNKPEDGKIFESNLDMKGEFCETVWPENGPRNLAISSNNSLTLYWHATDAADRFPSAQGFKLRWFVRRKLRPGLDFCHPGSEFACSNGLWCIPVELACDAEAHCDDNSDLIKKNQIGAGCQNIKADSFVADFGIAAVVGLAVALVTVTLLTISLFTRCYYQRTKSLQRHSKNSLNQNYRQAAPPATGGTTVTTNLVVNDNNCCYTPKNVHHTLQYNNETHNSNNNRQNDGLQRCSSDELQQQQRIHLMQTQHDNPIDHLPMHHEYNPHNHNYRLAKMSRNANNAERYIDHAFFGNNGLVVNNGHNTILAANSHNVYNNVDGSLPSSSHSGGLNRQYSPNGNNMMYQIQEIV